jgi:trk system potassium uptake protein TrkA
MVIAVKDILSDKVVTLPTADYVIKDGQVMVMVGKVDDIEKIR